MTTKCKVHYLVEFWHDMKDTHFLQHKELIKQVIIGGFTVD